MAEYIYFVTSLPYCSLEREAPMSYSKFMHLAQEQLSHKDYQTLSKATFDHDKEKSECKILSDWDDFNYTLNEFITEKRAHKLGRSDKEYKARCAYNPIIEKRAEEIVALSNPLEAEKAILGEYFSFLSLHPVQSQFSLEALIIYGLLLQIKEKVGAFSKEKGKSEFDSLYSNIRKDISLRSNL